MHRNNFDYKYTFTYVYDHHVSALCCLHRMYGFWQLRHGADVSKGPSHVICTVLCQQQSSRYQAVVKFVDPTGL